MLLLSPVLLNTQIQVYIERTSTHKKFSEKCLRKTGVKIKCSHSIIFSSGRSPQLKFFTHQRLRAPNKLVVLQVTYNMGVCSRTDAYGLQDGTDQRQWISSTASSWLRCHTPTGPRQQISCLKPNSLEMQFVSFSLRAVLWAPLGRRAEDIQSRQWENTLNYSYRSNSKIKIKSPYMTMRDMLTLKKFHSYFYVLYRELKL